MGDAVNDYHAVLHNAVPQYLHAESTEFHFARFAWTVIFGAKGFLIGGFTRKVHIAVTEPTHMSYMVKELTGTELRDAYGGGGSEDNEDNSSSSDPTVDGSTEEALRNAAAPIVQEVEAQYE